PGGWSIKTSAPATPRPRPVRWRRADSAARECEGTSPQPTRMGLRHLVPAPQPPGVPFVPLDGFPTPRFLATTPPEPHLFKAKGKSKKSKGKEQERRHQTPLFLLLSF